jgi:hypothetical protein
MQTCFRMLTQQAPMRSTLFRRLVHYSRHSTTKRGCPRILEFLRTSRNSEEFPWTAGGVCFGVDAIGPAAGVELWARRCLSRYRSGLFPYDQDTCACVSLCVRFRQITFRATRQGFRQLLFFVGDWCLQPNERQQHSRPLRESSATSSN